MTSFLSRLFSDRYANHNAIGNNLLLLAMYRFAYPFAYGFNALRLTPNQLTVLSCLSAVAAFYALWRYESPIPFSALWAVSVLLDFCDGTVARMSGRVSRTAFRFDHMTDLAKVSLIIIGAGLRYADTLTWVLSATALFTFLYYSILNQELKAVRKNIAVVRYENAGAGFQGGLPLPLRIAYASIATINGHTLLVFFIFPLGWIWTIGALTYLIGVATLGSVARIRQLMRLPKP